MSIYGSLDPKFQIPELGISLKEAFEGKLLIVLDDKFSPLAGSIAEMEPSRMLPNGPQVRRKAATLFVPTSKYTPLIYIVSDIGLQPKYEVATCRIFGRCNKSGPKLSLHCPSK